MNLRPASALVLALVVAGCGSRPVHVTGTLTYRARIALPPTAKATVRLLETSTQDVPAAILAEQIIDPAGQVPIPFALACASDRIDKDRTYVVQARIAEGDTLLWTTETPVPVLTHGHGDQVEVVLQPGSAEPAPGGNLLHLLAFECGGDAYLIDYDLAHDTATLWSAAGPRVLQHEVAASGARYGDDRVMVWTKGRDLVRLEVDGKAVDGCRVGARQRGLDEAWAGGYHFRAAGNEPFWLLLAGPDSIVVKRPDHPDVRLPGVTTSEFHAGQVVVREAGGHTLHLSATKEMCLDGMSGWPSSAAVDVVLDGENYRGCGVWLH